MSVLNGIKNFLLILDANWTTIAVCLGLIIGIWKKVETYLDLDTEQKVAIAKKQIELSTLKMITDAELDFEKWNSAGSIKRSQVIKAIYKDYPVLEKVKDQDELIAWIDEQINNSLKTLRKVVKENAEKSVNEVGE